MREPANPGVSPEVNRPKSLARPVPNAQTALRTRFTKRQILNLAVLGIGLGISAYAFITGHSVIAVVCLVAPALFILMRTMLMVRSAPEQRGSRTPQHPEETADIAATLSRDRDNVVLFHNVAGPYGALDHVVVRRNGAVIAIDTCPHRGRVVEARGRLQLNGRVLEGNMMDQVRRRAIWFKDELRLRLDLRVYVHACLVFPHAYVAVRKPIRGVEVASLSYLSKLLARLSADRPMEQIVQRYPERLRDLFSAPPPGRRPRQAANPTSIVRHAPVTKPASGPAR